MFELEEPEKEEIIVTHHARETLRLLGLTKGVFELCKELEEELCPDQ